MSPPIAEEGDTVQTQIAAIRRKAESLCRQLDQEQSQAKKLRELNKQKDKVVESRLRYYDETKSDRVGESSRTQVTSVKTYVFSSFLYKSFD